MGNTVTIRPSNWTIAPQGAATPQANLPGTYSMDAARSGVYGHLADSLGRLAGIEMGLRRAERNNSLNNAKNAFLNDLMREGERLGTEDMDFGTQGERYKQFEQDRLKHYLGTFGGDKELEESFRNDVLIPATRLEFGVRHTATKGLHDKIFADFQTRLDGRLKQSGWDLQADSDNLDMTRQEVADLVTNRVIDESTAQGLLSTAQQQMQLNQLGVMAQTDPEAILGAVAGIRTPIAELSREHVLGGKTGSASAIKSSIYDQAVAAGHDPRMMLGIAKAESDFNPSAKSMVDGQGRYAAGTFQFRDPAAQDVGLIDDKGDRRFDPAANIDAAMRYMQIIKDAVPNAANRPDLLIAAWHAGPWNKDIQAGRVPAEYVSYVSKVLKHGYGEDGRAGMPEGMQASAALAEGTPQGGYAKDRAAYGKLLSMGYTMQQALHFVDLAESNVAAQQRQAEQQAAMAYTEFVNSSYAQMWNEAGERLPDMESRHNYMSVKINSIADRELRGRYQALLKSDIDADVTRQNAVDLQIIHNVMQEVKAQGLSHNRAWETIQSNPALVAGISDAGMKSLETEIVGERKVTLKNQAAANSLKYWIDKGRGQLTREQIQSAIFEADLTMDQSNDVLSYFDGSGKMKTATYSAVNSELKRQTDDKQDLSKMPFLYEGVLNSLPDGEPANSESISRAVNKLLMEGEQVRSGMWNKSMTYAEALENGVGSSWLPELSKEEKLIAQAELQTRGVSNITEHKLQVYWRETKLGLPEYKTARQQDVLRQLPGLARATMWGGR